MSVHRAALLALHILKWSRSPCPNRRKRRRVVTRRPPLAVAAAAVAAAAAAAADGWESHSVHLRRERLTIPDGGSDLQRPPSTGLAVVSAGTRAAVTANPRTESMLRELGLTLPSHVPQVLSNDLMDRSRIRITTSCLDDASCPAHLKSLELRDWGLPDPAKLDDGQFRAVSDQLVGRIDGLRREIALTHRRETARAPVARP
jgi:protein-tyrosine-phosphatase